MQKQIFTTQKNNYLKEIRVIRGERKLWKQYNQ
ncbi:hypothetical protein FPSM_00815 [Flavobacterium psychrophilum]|nr:hypothetical protein FPSM_00815 [Flavobacterium psychrophilum]